MTGNRTSDRCDSRGLPPESVAMTMNRTILALSSLLFAATASAALQRYFSGSDVDVRPKLHGPALDLAGGGKDVEPALQSMIDRVRGCTSCDTTVDVLVLRASGAEGYNPLFMSLRGVNSVASVVITDRESSDRDDVVALARHAEVVFFAGGDQCNYVRWIKGTRLGDAVKSVYRRGGGVGGTSAGLAIQSDVIYDACPSQSAQSKDVLLDPYSVDVSLSRGFFHWKPMRNTISDTHFKQRDRMGRLLVFLARSIRDGHGARFLGIGVSERTSVVVSDDGKGVVMGEGPAYLVLADHQPEVCAKGTPLTYRGFRVWRYEAGATLDLAHWPTTGGKTIDVTEGKLSADPY
jgi:cyanophycinase